MDRAIADLPTKSAKIRALAAAGHGRAEIARLLSIRYQHVRNVLVGDEQRARQASIKSKVEAEAVPEPIKLKVAPDGRIVLPAAYRNALGIADDETLVARMEGREIRLYTVDEAVARARRLVGGAMHAGGNLVDDLLADRRRETKDR